VYAYRYLQHIATLRYSYSYCQLCRVRAAGTGRRAGTVHGRYRYRVLDFDCRHPLMHTPRHVTPGATVVTCIYIYTVYNYGTPGVLAWGVVTLTGVVVVPAAPWRLETMLETRHPSATACRSHRTVRCS
jgi:hypothetical protein